MTKEEKYAACKKFFNKLAGLLTSADYVVVSSCNNDRSIYLTPSGTEGEITYKSKPAKSFRVSDHWNWYANTGKCPNPRYVQCLCVDMPYAHKRKEPHKASRPIEAAAVAITDDKGIYHVIYGEVYDKKTRTWNWLSCDVVPAMNDEFEATEGGLIHFECKYSIRQGDGSEASEV